jgi:hypothetical protein
MLTSFKGDKILKSVSVSCSKHRGIGDCSNSAVGSLRISTASTSNGCGMVSVFFEVWFTGSLTGIWTHRQRPPIYSITNSLSDRKAFCTKALFRPNTVH